ncbi:hypothetical protein H2509_18145 [Stappia sp. F7233]|uniref:Uncharacterized protein n=1 Tax=Stappia albiluteola TaxID=2758565 RepID=A0A839AJC8_9HYPH|nr:hypothetical protein [Stappia albiluteola]MBA5779054.1 hypothetical protein [Stappia albiluteola]
MGDASRPGACPSRALCDPVAAEQDAPPVQAISKLERAIAAERQRGKDGHWSFDANRLIGLMLALERAAGAKTGPTPGGRTRQD